VDPAIGLAVPFRNDGILERARLGLIAAVAALAACRGIEQGTALRIPGDRGPHTLVEVLNAGGKSGSARTAARVLRQAGIDVVYFGDTRVVPDPLDSTRILVRRGDAAVGDRVRRALGVGKVVVQRDSTLLLDASVLLGRDFSPGQGFHP
jgi:hypothetical protein